MKTSSSRRSADDRGFRLGTGFFALLVVLLVAGIFFELYRTSQLSLSKFGFKFWTGRTWDPVSGEFGAFPPPTITPKTAVRSRSDFEAEMLT